MIPHNDKAALNFSKKLAAFASIICVFCLFTLTCPELFAQDKAAKSAESLELEVVVPPSDGAKPAQVKRGKAGKADTGDDAAVKGLKQVPTPAAGQVKALDPQAADIPASPPAAAPAPSASTPEPAPAASENQTELKGPSGPLQPQAVLQLSSAKKGGEIVLGALLPRSGSLSSFGETSKVAMDLAMQDVDSYLQTAGSKHSLRILLEDTGGSPRTALEKLKGLSVKGVKVVIGPFSDDEADAVRDFADKNNILLLSQGSGGPYLAKKGDNLLRFCPMNSFQAQAVASLAVQEGNTLLVPIWRGDIYGDELVVHVKAHFQQLGGKISAGVRYKPGTTHFAAYVSDLKAQIEKAGKQKVCIYFAGGDEIAYVLKEAAKLGGLSDHNWYGSDANALSNALAKDSEASAFAINVRLLSPRIGEGSSNMYTALEKRIEDKVGAYPDPYSAVTYDAIWVAVRTALACGGLDNIESVKRALPLTAERTFGATGWLALNEAGDRRENWAYDFWMIRKDGGKFFWEKAARFQFEPGTTPQLFVAEPQ